MPVFQNQDNQAQILHPPGDYKFRVVGMESGIQTGTGKTVGSPYWELKLAIEEKGGVVFERLIDHPSSNWKIDTFLKCTAAAPPTGTPFEFEQQAAEAAGVLWVNPVGLRGWAHLVVDEYTPNGSTEKRKRNKVGTFYTDKPKLPRAEIPATEQAPPPASVAAAPAAAGELTDDEIPF